MSAIIEVIIEEIEMAQLWQLLAMAIMKTIMALANNENNEPAA
jgi:hypothetical protein